MLGPALDAPHVAVGVWLRLQSFAASDEVESPRLVGARLWTHLRWVAATQCNLDDVTAAVTAGLARWDGDDLVIEGFDAEGIATVKARREAGKLGGRPPKTSPKPKVSKPKTSPKPHPNPSPLLSSPLQKTPSVYERTRDLFVAKWEAAYHGEKYPFAQKDGVQLAALLKTSPHVAKGWEGIVVKFLADAWHGMNGRHGLAALCSNVVRYSGPVASNGAPSRAAEVRDPNERPRTRAPWEF